MFYLKTTFSDIIRWENVNLEITDSIIKNDLSIEDLIKYAEKIIPYIDNIVSRLSSNEITTRTNLMKYALEIFEPKYPTNAAADRKKIIEAIKSLAKKNNK